MQHATRPIDNLLTTARNYAAAAEGSPCAVEHDTPRDSAFAAAIHCALEAAVRMQIARELLQDADLI